MEANRSSVDFMLVLSLARSRALIAAFKEGRASSRPFGLRDLLSIVETEGGRKRVVGKAQREGFEGGHCQTGNERRSAELCFVNISYRYHFEVVSITDPHIDTQLQLCT